MQAGRVGRFRGGRRAFGYEADGRTVRNDEAKILHDMARKVLDGRSVRSIAAELNEAGCRGTLGGAWTGASVHNVLLRARNAALIEHDGEIVGPAEWEPVILEDTWRAVARTLRDPARISTRTPERCWLGSGLYLCGRCGAPVQIASAGKNKPHARPYYRCSGPQVHLSRVAERVDELVAGVVVARLRQPDAAVLLPHPPEKDPSALHDETEALRGRLDELTHLFTTDGTTARQLAQGSEPLRICLDDLDCPIAYAHRGSSLEEFLGGADPAKVWEGLPLDTRRAVVNTLVKVTILPATPGRKAGGHYFDPESVQIDFKTEQ